MLINVVFVSIVFEFISCHQYCYNMQSIESKISIKYVRIFPATGICNSLPPTLNKIYNHCLNKATYETTNGFIESNSNNLVKCVFNNSKFL